MKLSQKQLRSLIESVVKKSIKESVLDKLEAATGQQITPGRNVLWGQPVDIDDDDPSMGLSMTAVDRDARDELVNQFRRSGFKCKVVGKGLDLLIQESKKSLRENAAGNAMVEDPAGWFVEAFAHLVENDHVLGSNAFEMWMGSTGAEGPMLPARIEDVDGAAQSAAEIVCSDPRMVEAVKDVIKNMIESAMP